MAFATSTGQHLGFDDIVSHTLFGQFLSGRTRLLRGARDKTTGHVHVELTQEIHGLMFVDIQVADL